jgi:hypothetical protein
MNAEYRKRTYDPTWALKFDDKFDSAEMRSARSKAAKALKDKQGRLGCADYTSPDIDDVLDFFEGLGFFMQGDQITPEVAHHAFHHWIRGYYSAAKEYLEAAQKTEPSHWEYVRTLFEITNQVERERVRKKGKHKILLDEGGIAKFLDEEICLQQSRRPLHLSAS